jgi:DNA polymerase III epsilon subunit-like protein
MYPAGPAELCASSCSLCAAFDLPRLHRAAIKYGLPALRAARVLDSYHLAAAVFPSPLGGPGQPPSLKLGALFQHFTGAAPAVSHRAQQDCDSNLLVLQRLVELLPVDGLAGGTCNRFSCSPPPTHLHCAVLRFTSCALSLRWQT